MPSIINVQTWAKLAFINNVRLILAHDTGRPLLTFIVPDVMLIRALVKRYYLNACTLCTAVITDKIIEFYIQQI